jgi:hypothetical protein
VEAKERSEPTLASRKGRRIGFVILAGFDPALLPERGNGLLVSGGYGFASTTV